MKYIRSQKTVSDAREQMVGVRYGDTVIVLLKTKEIPCVVRRYRDTGCGACVLCREDCTKYRGYGPGVSTCLSFIPIEETVE